MIDKGNYLQSPSSFSLISLPWRESSGVPSPSLSRRTGWPALPSSNEFRLSLPLMNGGTEEEEAGSRLGFWGRVRGRYSKRKGCVRGGCGGMGVGVAD